MKIIIIGDSNVGKSCLLTQFIDNIFRDASVTTHGIGF